MRSFGKQMVLRSNLRVVRGLIWSLTYSPSKAAYLPIWDQYLLPPIEREKAQRQYIYIYLLYLFIKQQHLPPPRGRHASCQESRDISIRTKNTKTKEQKEEKITPNLQARPQTNLHPKGFNIAGTTQSCSISSKSGVHPLGYASSIPPNKLPPFIPIIHHPSCLPNIQFSTFILFAPWTY